MKTSRGVLAAMVLSVVGLCLVLLAQTEESSVSVEELRTALAGMEAVDATSVSEGGTFYLFSDYLFNDGESGAPYPFVPPQFAEASIYSLGDSAFLVDNLDLSLNGSFSMMSLDPGEGEEGGGEGESGGETNCLVWPVNLSELTLVAPTNVPESGVFYLYLDQTNGDTPPPYPYDIVPECPVYYLCLEGHYLIDDTGCSRPEPQGGGTIYEPTSFVPGTLYLQLTNVSGGVARMILHGTESGVSYTIQSASSPLGVWTPEVVITGATNQDWTPANVTVGNRNSSFFQAHVGADALPLWLEILPLGTNAYNSDLNSVTLVVHNAEPDIAYQIQSKQALADAVWTAEPNNNLIGSSSTNIIPTTVSMVDRPVCFFRAIAYTLDTDGGGLPDWWQLQYFGYVGVDPYADNDGDGWNNLQEFLRSTNPTNPNAPPPPQSLTVRFDSTGTNVVITWQPGGGPVAGYTIYAYPGYVVDSVGPAVTSFTNALLPPSYYGDINWVAAENTNGASSSFWVSAPKEDLWKGARIVRGPMGQLVATLLSPSTNLAYVRFLGSATDPQTSQTVYPTFDISMSTFANGIAVLPTNQTENWSATGSTLPGVRGLTTEGRFGGISDDLLDDSWWLDAFSHHHQFADASALLKQNLQFLLRSATVNDQFSCYLYYGKATNDYAYAGYFWGSDEMIPVQQNFLWRNFVFVPAADGTNNWSTGAGYSDNYDSRTLVNPKYQFSGFSNPPPLAFSLGSSSQLYYRNLDVTNSSPTAFAELGLVSYTDGHLGMDYNVLNAYGLPINNVQLINTNLVWTISPGGYIGPLRHNESSPYFANAASPNLQTVSYYFNTFDYFGDLPGDEGFTPAKTTPLLVAGWGKPWLITGWAKQAILNGYTNKFGYLQQYFDKAYKMNSNGVVTAQQTGILSPYGDFFPTESERVALVTMPDIETGQRGTGIVYVVKIQFDVNHDGVMDTSFSGPDNTSENGSYTSKTGPFIFWANNDYDRGHTVDSSDFEEDDLGPKDINKLPVEQRVVDGQYTTNGLPAIPSMRDLEDYARMWIPGLSNLIADLPTNYTVKLTSQYKMRVFRAIESDGGTGYLFNEATASNQVANSTSLYVGEATYNSPIVLNGKTNLGEHFILCWSQASGGSSILSLQVFDEGQNYVGGPTAYVHINDIKDMYERWTVGERPAYPPTNIAQRAEDSLPYHYQAAGIPFQYPYDHTVDTNTPYILFVHGWNMETWEKDRFAETAFKRLYWQGYQGRFGSFRWPTLWGFDTFNWQNPVTAPNHYDKSEFNAWKSGAGLHNLLTQLDGQYPSQVRLMAHSMGNVVAGEALRTNTPLVHTYVAMQAAVPSHAYDPNVTSRSLGAYDDSTPNRYSQYYTNGANAYFSDSAGAVNFVNLYNTNDYAFTALHWQLDQNLKPADSIGYQFYPLSGFFTHNGDFLNFPGDTYELFSFCVEARCFALGAQPNVSGSFSSGEQVALDAAPYSFGSAHKGHSGQFRSTNMKRAAFWTRLLIRTGLKEE